MAYLVMRSELLTSFGMKNINDFEVGIPCSVSMKIIRVIQIHVI